jgi:hypothetical protein
MTVDHTITLTARALLAAHHASGQTPTEETRNVWIE